VHLPAPRRNRDEDHARGRTGPANRAATSRPPRPGIRLGGRGAPGTFFGFPPEPGGRDRGPSVAPPRNPSDMPTAAIPREYEAMFLLDNEAATADFDGVAGQVDAILGKHGAEIVHKEKWDERKLAYEIKGHRRATYYLVYFRAPTSALRDIDGDMHLSEVVLRWLPIALEEPIDAHIEKRAQEREKMAEESRRASLTGWGGKKSGGRKSRGGEGRGDDDDGPPRGRSRSRDDDGDNDDDSGDNDDD
jgi:small subunit ribosomal protein S6